MRVQPGEDGVLVYHAQPEGRPDVPFRLALTATLSLLDGGRAQSFTFRRR